MQQFMRYIYNMIASLYYKRKVSKYSGGYKYSEKILLNMLNEAKDTVYGKEYGFNNIESGEGYSKKVPLATYTDIEPYINRLLKGEKSILTKEDPIYFALSSGTTGSQKHIPMTKTSMHLANMTMMFFQQGALNQILPSAIKGDRGLLIMGTQGSKKSTDSEGDEINSGSATGGGLASMGKAVEYFWVTPAAALTIEDREIADYVRLLFALSEPKLSYIGAPFAPAVVLFFATLKKHWDKLAQDIEKGTINKELNLDTEIRKELESKLKPNPTRAAEIEKIAQEGFSNIATRLWPKLLYINTVISGDFAIYQDQLRYYIGDIPIYSGVYGASEAPIGIGASLNDAQYLLSAHATYFEFIPEEESIKENPSVLPISKVKIGESYEIVITSTSGFYRYRIGDVVEIIKIQKGIPIVKFCYRRNNILNLAAEKTTAEALNTAVNQAINEAKLTLIDYTTMAKIQGETPRYKFYIELGKGQELPKDFEDILENALINANPRYGVGRAHRNLEKCCVERVDTGSFEAYKKFLVSEGASYNQIKVPRYLSTEKQQSFFKKLTIKEENNEYIN